jgi:hypothetical protein
VAGCPVGSPGLSALVRISIPWPNHNVDFRRSITKRQTTRASAGVSYLGSLPVGTLWFDASLCTAGEVVASMHRVEAIGAASRHRATSAVARDQGPSGEAKSKTLSAVTMGAWRSTEGVLA